jgi:TolA-binding protein
MMQDAAEAKYGQIDSNSASAGSSSSSPSGRGQGEGSSGSNSSPSGRGKGEGLSKTSSKPPTEKEREAARRAEQERLAARAKAFKEILPYWQEPYLKARSGSLPYFKQMLKDYPETPRREEALYLSAVILFEVEQWRASADTFEIVLQQYPRSRFLGDVHVKLIDITLEHLFDLAEAHKHAIVANQWLIDLGKKSAHAASKQKKSKKDKPLWAVFTTPYENDMKRVKYDVYLRAGLVAYLQKKYDQAIKHFEAAKPFEPPRDFEVIVGHIPTGMERVIDAAKNKKQLTPAEVLVGNQKVALMLQLADIYKTAGSWDKAISLCGEVFEAPAKLVSPQQRSWSHFVRAGSYFRIPQCADAIPEYQAAHKACPKAPWASQALFYMGTTTSSFLQDKEAAANIYKQVVKKYPNSNYAPKASYLVGVCLENLKEWKKAKVAFEDYVKKYPDSRWVVEVEREHFRNIAKQLASKPNTKGK